VSNEYLNPEYLGEIKLEITPSASLLGELLDIIKKKKCLTDRDIDRRDIIYKELKMRMNNDMI